MTRWLAALVAIGLLTAGGAGAQEPAAKDLFGTVASATGDVPRALGGYSKGCLAGAEALPLDGEGWQVMRLSRNRNWGHPRLLATIERLAASLRAQGHQGILVGDMAQPRGGPMRSGHASHQIGLDADIWLTPMPAHRLDPADRETVSAVSMLSGDWRRVDPQRLGPWQRSAIRTAAELPEVERVFVNPAIKRALCETPRNGDWMSKVRPWWGHDAHFHLRLACPEGEPGCRPQGAPAAGDGCGGELDWWLSEEGRAPPRPTVPPPPLRLADLPAACTAVLRAP